MRVALLLSLLCAVHADYYRKLENASCADCDVPATLGFCPRSLIVKEGGLDAGKCADIGYTVAKGKMDQKAGPCGTLHFETYAKAAGSSNTCSEGVAKLIAINGTLPEPRGCVQQGLKMQELVKDYQCTASLLREACNGVGHPNVFGCADVTAAGCAECFNHKEAFENVCVWCKTDSTCHDVGSLLDPCTNDQCISIAVKTKCTDHDVGDCPSN